MATARRNSATVGKLAGPSPVDLLDGRLRELQAYLLVCRVGATKKAVHRLRDTIRTVAAALQKALHGLRRFAGRVRDHDVFADLLAAHEAEIALDADDTRRVHDDCRKLRKVCRKHRKRAVGRLVKAIESQETEVAAAAEALRHTLKPGRDQHPPAAEILRVTNDRFAHELQAFRGLASPTDKDRHEVRKAAKQARLCLEFAGDDPAAAAAAECFHALQHAGGDWHDWLELTALAIDELGPHRAATRAISARRDRFLRTFEERLGTFPANPEMAEPPDDSHTGSAAG
jgi:CHAD domain-containing protein